MTDLNADDLVKLLEGLEGVPAGPWSAHMDDLTLHVERSSFIPDNYTLALCATGDHAYKLTPHLARCDPDTIRALVSEVQESRRRAAMQDGVAVGWVDIRTIGKPWDDGLLLVSNPEYVQNNGPENFAPLYTHPSPVNGVMEGVKGLEWEYGQKTARASVPFGEYQVDEYTEADGIGYVAIFNDNEELGEFPIIDEAIAACQADFAKRVSSCLSTLATPTPAVTVDRMREQPTAFLPEPMSTAPKDGSMLRLLVRFDGDSSVGAFEDADTGWTIGTNNLSNTGDDQWDIVGWDWEQDTFRQAHTAEPIGWLPLLSTLSPEPSPQSGYAVDEGQVTIIEQSETLDGGYALTLELDGRDTVIIARFEGVPS